MYEENTCWYGDPMPSRGTKQGTKRDGICGKPGSPAYTVGKGNLGIGTCRMYLCNDHKAVLVSHGFTVIPIYQSIANVTV